MQTYAPSEVKINILGIDVEGFPDGVFVTVVPEMPTYSTRRAMDGSTEITRMKWQNYRIGITLHQSSPSNDWLNILHGLFKDNNLPLKMPILIRDKSGRASFFASDCWFEKEPSMSYANNLMNTEWSFFCTGGTLKHGGNGDIAAAAEILGAIQLALTLSNNLGIDLGVFQDTLGEVVESVSGSLGGII